MDLHAQLKFYGILASLMDENRLRAYLDSTRNTEWVVYAKLPFSGPRRVLEYLSRYTHRVAISNHRIIDELRLLHILTHINIFERS